MTPLLAGADVSISDPLGFPNRLATRQDPALRRPLGHLVSPDAPGGTAHDLLRPVSAPQAAPTRHDLPVQRRAAPSTDPDSAVLPAPREPSGADAATPTGAVPATASGPPTGGEPASRGGPAKSGRSATGGGPSVASRATPTAAGVAPRAVRPSPARRAGTPLTLARVAVPPRRLPARLPAPSGPTATRMPVPTVQTSSAATGARSAQKAPTSPAVAPTAEPATVVPSLVTPPPAGPTQHGPTPSAGTAPPVRPAPPARRRTAAPPRLGLGKPIVMPAPEPDAPAAVPSVPRPTPKPPPPRTAPAGPAAGTPGASGETRAVVQRSASAQHPDSSPTGTPAPHASAPGDTPPARTLAHPRTPDAVPVDRAPPGAPETAPVKSDGPSSHRPTARPGLGAPLDPDVQPRTVARPRSTATPDPAPTVQPRPATDPSPRFGGVADRPGPPADAPGGTATTRPDGTTTHTGGTATDSTRSSAADPATRPVQRAVAPHTHTERPEMPVTRPQPPVPPSAAVPPRPTAADPDPTRTDRAARPADATATEPAGRAGRVPLLGERPVTPILRRASTATTAPQHATPGATGPQYAVPGATGPQYAVPGATGPQYAAPGATAADGRAATVPIHWIRPSDSGSLPPTTTTNPTLANANEVSSMTRPPTASPGPLDRPTPHRRAQPRPRQVSGAIQLAPAATGPVPTATRPVSAPPPPPAARLPQPAARVRPPLTSATQTAATNHVRNATPERPERPGLPVQRASTGHPGNTTTVPPTNSVPARQVQRSTPAGAATTTRTAHRSAGSASTSGGADRHTGPEHRSGREDRASAEQFHHLDRRALDELAHRLIEPISRLLRAELRTGRERSDRWLDGRR
ncbi:hypothetical protein [Micromonospora sp. NPDC000442]|uniref:hypothetical protein n=1 Tax=Micromonospora sp. NPDC000442 TaxID=3364217 RepID=UPI0036B83DCC